MENLVPAYFFEPKRQAVHMKTRTGVAVFVGVIQYIGITLFFIYLYYIFSSERTVSVKISATPLTGDYRCSILAPLNGHEEYNGDFLESAMFSQTFYNYDSCVSILEDYAVCNKELSPNDIYQFFYYEASGAYCMMVPLIDTRLCYHSAIIESLNNDNRDSFSTIDATKHYPTLSSNWYSIDNPSGSLGINKTSSNTPLYTDLSNIIPLSIEDYDIDSVTSNGRDKVYLLTDNELLGPNTMNMLYEVDLNSASLRTIITVVGASQKKIVGYDVDYERDKAYILLGLSTNFDDLFLLEIDSFSNASMINVSVATNWRGHNVGPNTDTLTVHTLTAPSLDDASEIIHRPVSISAATNTAYINFGTKDRYNYSFTAFDMTTQVGTVFELNFAHLYAHNQNVPTGFIEIDTITQIQAVPSDSSYNYDILYAVIEDNDEVYYLCRVSMENISNIEIIGVNIPSEYLDKMFSHGSAKATDTNLDGSTNRIPNNVGTYDLLFHNDAMSNYYDTRGNEIVTDNELDQAYYYTTKGLVTLQYSVCSGVLTSDTYGYIKYDAPITFRRSPYCDAHNGMYFQTSDVVDLPFECTMKEPDSVSMLSNRSEACYMSLSETYQSVLNAKCLPSFHVICNSVYYDNPPFACAKSEPSSFATIFSNAFAGAEFVYVLYSGSMIIVCSYILPFLFGEAVLHPDEIREKKLRKMDEERVRSDMGSVINPNDIYSTHANDASLSDDHERKVRYLLYDEDGTDRNSAEIDLEEDRKAIPCTAIDLEEDPTRNVQAEPFVETIQKNGEKYVVLHAPKYNNGNAREVHHHHHKRSGDDWSSVGSDVSDW